MHSSTTTPVPTRLSPTVIILTLCFGSLAGTLTQTTVIPIQSELPRLLNASAANTSWAVTATLLAAAVTMPVAGRLADIYGKKRILVVSSAILVIGSVVAALSSTLLPFLVGRTLQGMSMGYVPVAISLVRQLIPPAKAAGAVAAISATLGVGGALGIPLFAWIAQNYTLQALFWFSAVFAVAILLLTAFVIPHVHDAHPAHIDFVGILGLAVGLGAALVGVSKGSSWGWSDGRTLTSIIGGVVVLLLWGLYELRHHDPLVDLRTTARRPVLFTNLAAILIGFGMMGQAIVLPQLLQMPESTGFGLGQTMLAAGLWMAPGGLMMMFFAPVSSHLINSVGARITLSVGAFVTAAGYLVGLFLMDAPWQLMLASIVGSAGIGIGYAAMPTLILDNVPDHEAGSSVGLNGLMRSVGTTIAGAVMAAVLTSRTMDLSPGVTIPTQGAFQLCFLIGAVAAFAGALVALLVPRQQRPGRRVALAPAEKPTSVEVA